MPDAMHPTKSRLLDAAEAIFAARGYDGASLRAILIEAGRPGQLALIRYHFGTKNDLYRAVWERAVGARTNATARPTALSHGSDAVEIQLRRLIQIFLQPSVELGQSKRGRAFHSIMLQEIADPRQAERGLVRKFLTPATEDLMHSLTKLLPHLTLHEAGETAHVIITIARTIMENYAPEGFAFQRSADPLSFTTNLIVRGLLSLENSRLCT